MVSWSHASSQACPIKSSCFRSLVLYDVSNKKNLKEGSVTSSKVGERVSRKIHTDKSPNLKHETLIALMAMKSNANNDCYESCFSDELLTKCKKATCLAVKDSQNPADNLKINN